MKKYIGIGLVAVILLVSVLTVTLSAATETVEYSATDSRLKYTGRTIIENSEVVTEYGMTSLSFNVKAESVEVKLSTEYAEGTGPRYAVYINDELKEKFFLKSGSNWYDFKNLNPNEVTNVRLVKMNNRSISKIQGVKVKGELLAGNAPKKMLVEVIGDSITEGIGTIKTTEKSEAQNTDVTLTYASRIATRLNADLQIVAASGRGVYQNGTLGKPNEETVPVLYSRQLGAVISGTYTPVAHPNLIIVNLGTNDQEVADISQVGEAAKSFLSALRNYHPDAYIVWTYGLMGSNLTDTLKNAVNEFALNDSKVFYMPLKDKSVYDNNEEWFDQYKHPNPKAHIGVANDLYNQISNAGIIEGINQQIYNSSSSTRIIVGAQSSWEYDTSYITGDANNDYSINIADLLRLKKETRINNSNADLNGDGNINENDRKLLREKLLK